MEVAPCGETSCFPTTTLRYHRAMHGPGYCPGNWLALRNHIANNKSLDGVNGEDRAN